MSTDEERAFYLSPCWQSLRKQKLALDPLCQCCEQSSKVVPASMVHHMLPILQFPEERLNIKFLLSLCIPCHQVMESEQRAIEIEKQDEAIRKAGG
jgi:5-methylcytosine-specific restriction protein A